MREQDLLPKFQNKDSMYEMIDAFAQEHARDSTNLNRVAKFISVTHKAIVEPVFQFAESPIELIFLNSLNIHFVAQMPMGLHIKQPLEDFPEYMKYCYELWDALDYIYNDMTKSIGEQPAVSDFLLVVEDVACRSGNEGLLPEANLFGSLRCWNLDFACLVMQSGFPKIFVDSKSIRTDMAIFSPKYKGLHFVVECDGYHYHSDKESFRKDRIRDRKLKEKGFDVLRYSGSEIYNNPL